MDTSLEMLCRRIVDWEARAREVPVSPRLSRKNLLNRLAAYDFATPRDLAETMEDIADLLEIGGLHSTSPRYFGLFIPGVHRAGVIADALAAAYNPQLGAWWHAPAAVEIERRSLDYFRRRIGLESPESTSTFTTGGSEANLTGVLVALARSFPKYAQSGLAGISAQPVFYASDQAHDSFLKIAQVTGLGRVALRRIRSDPHQRLDITVLRRTMARDRAEGYSPFLVVGTVGTTATGAIDPLPQLAALCREEGLSLHADAAWGGLAVLSDTLRQSVAGLELADSITWDAHKTLPVPMGAGMFFCRWRLPQTIFAVRPTYVPEPEPGTDDPYQQTIQWSRRFIGLKVFLTLAELGADGVAKLIDHQAAMAQLLRESLVSNGWRVMNSSPLPLVCFTRDEISPDNIRRIARAVAAEGHVWISDVHLPSGAHWLRACITHHQTTPDDIQELVAAVNRALSVS